MRKTINGVCAVLLALCCADFAFAARGGGNGHAPQPVPPPAPRPNPLPPKPTPKPTPNPQSRVLLKVVMTQMTGQMKRTSTCTIYPTWVVKSVQNDNKAPLTEEGPFVPPPGITAMINETERGTLRPANPMPHPGLTLFRTAYAGGEEIVLEKIGKHLRELNNSQATPLLLQIMQNACGNYGTDSETESSDAIASDEPTDPTDRTITSNDQLVVRLRNTCDTCGAKWSVVSGLPENYLKLVKTTYEVPSIPPGSKPPPGAGRVSTIFTFPKIPVGHYKLMFESQIAGQKPVGFETVNLTVNESPTPPPTPGGKPVTIDGTLAASLEQAESAALREIGLLDPPTPGMHATRADVVLCYRSDFGQSQSATCTLTRHGKSGKVSDAKSLDLANAFMNAGVFKVTSPETQIISVTNLACGVSYVPKPTVHCTATQSAEAL